MLFVYDYVLTRLNVRHLHSIASQKSHRRPMGDALTWAPMAASTANCSKTARFRGMDGITISIQNRERNRLVPVSG